jgi:hypothetical protein
MTTPKAPKLDEDEKTKLEASNYEIRVSRASLEMNTFGKYKDRNMSTIVNNIEAIMVKFPLLPEYAKQSACTMRNLAELLAGKNIPYYVHDDYKEGYMDKQAVLLGIVIARIAMILFCVLDPLEYDKEKDSSRELAYLHSYAFHHVNVFNVETKKYAREAIVDHT